MMLVLERTNEKQAKRRYCKSSVTITVAKVLERDRLAFVLKFVRIVFSMPPILGPMGPMEDI